jgi:hypothetical protein
MQPYVCTSATVSFKGALFFHHDTLLDNSHACLGLMLRFYRAICLQVTHTALATPEVLARLCPCENASPFQRFIRDLLLFFAATYKVRWAAPSGLMHTSAKVPSCLQPFALAAHLVCIR